MQKNPSCFGCRRPELDDTLGDPEHSGPGSGSSTDNPALQTLHQTKTARTRKVDGKRRNHHGCAFLFGPPPVPSRPSVLNLGFREAAFLPLQDHPTRGVHTSGINGRQPSLSTIGSRNLRLRRTLQGIDLAAGKSAQKSFSCGASTPSRRAFMSPILRFMPGMSNPLPR